jgi:hypothetical protein
MAFLTEADQDQARPSDYRSRLRTSCAPWIVTGTYRFSSHALEQLAHQLAQLSSRITADVIEADEFPELSERFNVLGVPDTVIDGVEELVGAQPEARVVAAIRAVLSHSKGTDS